MKKTNSIDKMISAVSPRAGYERMAWRNALAEQARSYDAGGYGRLNDGWRVQDDKAEALDFMHRDTIRARGRDLERNSDVLEAIITSYERNVIGRGFRLQAKTGNESLNTQIEELWRRWTNPRNCDVTATQSFDEMCRMVVRRMRVDGGIFILKRYTGEGLLPFKLQALEVDDLDSGKLSEGNKRIVSGIELSEYNRPVAYYFKKYDAYGACYGESTRVQADDVIFLWNKQRPTQIREISNLKHTLPRIRDIHQYIEAVSVKERVAACLAAFIKRVNPTPGSTGGTYGRSAGLAPGNKTYDGKFITPGMIMELNPGDDIAAVTPPAQGGSSADFARLQQRIAGSGQGLSYEAASRDMSQVNYSSARQGLLEDRKTYQLEQQYLINHFFTEVYETFLISCVLAGKLDIPGFWENKAQYFEHTWTPPGQRWIDPLKEARAYEVGLNTNQITLEEITAENGQDWREVLLQRAKEVAYMKELGLTEGEEPIDTETKRNRGK